MNHAFQFRDAQERARITAWSQQVRDVQSRWYLFDQVLYDLCRKYPRHNNEHEVVAKLALIGRGYSAAVERRKNAAETPGDFYYDYVAPVIVSSGLDARLDALRKYRTPTAENLPEILSVHYYLQTLLRQCTAMEKRSLASKYLHFHCPNLFYIFDAFSKDMLGRIVRFSGRWEIPADADAEYAGYCLRSLFVQEQVSPDEENFPRILDAYLQTVSRA